MALEISVSASAERLQAQRDQANQLALERQRAAAVERARAEELQRAERTRADSAAQDVDRAQVQRAFIRDVTDAQDFEALRARDTEDARINERLAQEVGDLRQLLADEADADALLNELNDLPPLSPREAAPAPANDDVLRPDEASLVPFEDLLAERNARLAERADDERAFAQTQSQDFARSSRAVDAIQQDPGAIPDNPARGSVVDFQA